MNDSSDLTVSPEYAEKLYKAGFNQDKSYFMCVDGKIVARQSLAYMGLYKAEKEAVAAPIDSEILDELPIVLRKKNLCCSKSVPDIRGNPFWQVSYDWEAVFESVTLANAAAAMFCYLSENNLLPPTS